MAGDVNASTKAAKELVDAVNNTMFDRKAFAAEIMGSHRYLQMEVFRAFGECVKEWAKAKETGSYDRRNEYATTTSWRIVDQIFS